MLIALDLQKQKYLTPWKNMECQIGKAKYRHGMTPEDVVSSLPAAIGEIL